MVVNRGLLKFFGTKKGTKRGKYSQGKGAYGKRGVESLLTEENTANTNDPTKGKSEDGKPCSFLFGRKGE